LLAVEGKKGVKEIEPSVVQSLGHVQQDVIGTHELPNLDKYELKGDRANPLDIDGLFGPSRADWPWAFFGEDGKVYDEPPEHVRFRAKRVRPAELKRLLKGDRANPRRRKNTGWPAKIGPYKLKEVTDEYTWDRKNRHELATYGPFLIRSWSRDYYPDYWTVTMTGTPAVREAWGEVYGGRVMYAKADAIGFLDEHLRACGNPHNRANPRRRRNYVAPSGGERKTRVFFMETRGKKYNVKVYKAGSVYEVVIYERGAPSESFITSDKNEVWATVGQFYKVGHMTGTAKYRVKQDNLGLGIE
jgi:hypothetical protein